MTRQRKRDIVWDRRYPRSLGTTGMPSSGGDILWPDMRPGFLGERTVCWESDESSASATHRVQQRNNVSPHETLIRWSFQCTYTKAIRVAHQTNAIHHGRVPATDSARWCSYRQLTGSRHTQREEIRCATVESCNQLRCSKNTIPCIKEYKPPTDDACRGRNDVA